MEKVLMKNVLEKFNLDIEISEKQSNIEVDKRFLEGDISKKDDVIELHFDNDEVTRRSIYFAMYNGKYFIYVASSFYDNNNASSYGITYYPDGSVEIT